MNWRTLSILVLAAAICGGTASAGPVVATKWRMTGESRNDCLGHALEAIKRAGFQISDPGSESMSGGRGDYTASVRCVTEQNFVFFVVSGPDAGEANRLLSAIYQVF
jgi:hypothetical protein